MAQIPRLEIKHLAVLIAVAEGGSVTRAADQLGLTQSAVTHRIREAERRLGLQLFQRMGKRLIMTPAAERLCSIGERVVGELARVEQDVFTIHGQGKQLVRIGQGLYSRYHWLPEFLRYMEAKASDIEIDVVAQARYQPLTALRNGAVDVVVLYGNKTATQEFTWFDLGKDPLVVLMAPDHRLAAKPYITADDMAEERYITYSTVPEPGFEWEMVFRPAGVSPQRVSQVQMPEAIIDLVRAGFGVTALSSWAVEPEIQSGSLIAKPLTKKGVSLDWWAVMRANEPEGSAAWRVAQTFYHWNERDDGGLATLGFDE